MRVLPLDKNQRPDRVFSAASAKLSPNVNMLVTPQYPTARPIPGTGPASENRGGSINVRMANQ